MGILREIYTALKTYSSIFTFAVIAMADYLWEDKYFTCPCVNTGLRTGYSVAFVLSPAFFLLLADSNFRVLCLNCKSCLTEKYCRNRAGFARPCILAGTWVIYSIMDPRFSDCIAKGSFNEVTQGNCTEKDELTGKMKSYSAIAILLFSIFTLIFGMVIGCCRSCSGFSCTVCLSNWCKECSSSCKMCCCEKCSFENLKEEERLTGQTMTILDEEDLLENYFLQKLTDSDFEKLENKISMGQTIILKEHCQLLKPVDEQQAEQQSVRESNEGPDTSPSINDASNDFDRQAQQQNVEETNGEPGTSASDDFDTSVKTQRLGIKQSKKEEKIRLLSMPPSNYTNA